ncbi:hypothetical protein DS834_07950 [Lactobacillus bombicola]|uniref:Mobilization protein n=2 Tax=Lactobacillus bombicola TaxID=1505723 RepID=A0ABX9LT42_9LACO|nr:hypothetical protein DS834_07950 [Lactobacillus bombicola]
MIKNNETKKYRMQLDIRMPEEQYNALQNYKKENPNIKSNVDLFNELYNAWLLQQQNADSLKQIKTLTKEIRILKEQIAINNEMIAEHLNKNGVTQILLGIDAQVYKSAQQLVKDRMLDAQERNHRI